MLNIHEASPMRTILDKPVTITPNFVVDQETTQGKKQLLRKYFTPTEPNWGPKARATGAPVKK